MSKYTNRTDIEDNLINTILKVPVGSDEDITPAPFIIGALICGGISLGTILITLALILIL